VPYFKVYSDAGWEYFRQTGSHFQERQKDGTWEGASVYSSIEDIRELGNIVIEIPLSEVP
jgi:hypothetical protein